MSKKKPALSPWFPADVKPVRKGVYQTNGRGVYAFQFWNDKFWGYCASSRSIAASLADEESNSQMPKWRGLAEQPK